MAEQFLQGAEIRPSRQQMRCETVPQRMGRQAVGQAKPGPSPPQYLKR